MPGAAPASGLIEIALEDRTGVAPILEVPANTPVPLLPVPGEELRGLPAAFGEGVLYGILRHGGPDGGLSLAVHRAADGSERVVVDLNDNEDLADDPVLAWEGTYGVAGGRAVLPSLHATIELECPAPGGRVPVALVLQRYERERATGMAAVGLSNGVLATVDSYREGTATLDGKQVKVALVPTALAGSQGIFTHPSTALVIDVNGDGKLNGHPFKSNERFRLGSPFALGQRGFQATASSCDGRHLVLTPVDLAQVARARRPFSAPQPGDPAPEFVLPSIEGDTLRLSDYRGKLVLLDFWATWCGPCRAELPYVRRAYERYHERGFEVIGISLDTTAEQVRSFTAASKMPWPQILQGRGGMTPLKQSYAIQSIPAAFLVGKDGRIAATQLRGARLLETIEELLNKPRSD